MAQKITEFNIDIDLDTAKNITDLQERLQFLLEREKKAKQFDVLGVNYKQQQRKMLYTRYFDRMEIEIKYVEDLISRKNINTSVPAMPINKYFQFDNRIIETIVFP